MSLRCSELKRCAPSGADEEGAGLERNMRMSDSQQNHRGSFVCVHLCRDEYLTVHILPVHCVFASQGNVGCELN